ncbi:MAG TPA: hypothetical protein VH092_04980 [Urbifossiella sp.]|jgi:hypothetical protein|nr:hypothetical protein [Urbifossiella sp.]
MIPKAFDDVRPEDVQHLIEDGVRESRTLDYKQGLTPQDTKLFFPQLPVTERLTKGG